MSKRYAVLLALCFCAASVGHPAGQKLDYPAAKPGDQGYVAEDPQLERFVGRPGPSITLRAIDGGTINIVKNYGRKPIYLKLWATYCLPCRAQMPGLEKIYESFGDRMQIVAVNAGVGDDAAKVRAFVSGTKLRMPVAIDDGSLGAWLKMDSTPVHVLIGSDGRIAYAGHQDGPQLDAAIQRVLASAPTNASIEAAKIEPVATLKRGDLVPALELRGPDDRPVRLTRGPTARPRAILFTSTWCESYLKDTEPATVVACRRARELVDELSQTGTIDWLGVAAHLWTTPKALGSYEARMKTRVPMAVDSDGQAFRVFGIRRLPAVALIGADGRLVRMVGPDDTDLTAAVNKLTARP